MTALEEDLRRSVRGEVDFSPSVRAVYATDSSNYRQVPLGVVLPLDEDDVVAALRVCARHDAPVVARGAGTSLAGQAVNVAVVLDTSRHMTRILEVDPVAATARVQPGVVLDDLRRAAEVHGLTFGPDPATHAWCTLGGMIGNGSCGTHALFAGKTVDNVDRLRVATYAGDVLDVGSYTDEEYAAAAAAGGPLAPVLGGLREIARRYEPLVRQRFPDIPRRVSGFNLDELLPDKGFSVARALVGTESTCVVVTEATVRLSHSPAHRRLVVLGYPDIFAAADAVPALLEHPLLGLEGFDDTLVRQMRENDVNVAHLPLLPPGRGWLLAELGGDSADEADAASEAFVAALPADLERRCYADSMDQRRVWLIRESGLGATAIRPDGTHNAEGWEDAAVAPERLGAYLRGVSALWRDFGYSGAWYGHFGQGCVHTRNDFDLHTVEGLRRYRAYVERAADLVVSLGGSLSGEHGDGQARGELLERMYGPELVDAFRQFKAVFDPRGRMNPGKVVDAYPLDTNLRFGPGYEKRPAGKQFFSIGSTLQEAAERCVGVGRCRRDDTGTMCPSFRATRDERHSTRGRAKLLVEMFQGEVTPQTWRNEDVREALDLCLSCKGCVSDCPTHVDMATYKAEFLAHYYEKRLRPRQMYALGLFPWAARLGSRMPRLANAVLATRLARRAAGVTIARPAPQFSQRSWRSSLPAVWRDPTVVVWPDTFTDAFAPETGRDLVAVLEALGERVAVPTQWACCARPLYDTGMLDLARRSLRGLLDVLEPWTSRGIPVVVPEPSCLSSFRDELPKLLPDDPRAARLADLARSPAEHLLTLEGLPTLSSAAVVHPHCHASAGGWSGADRELLQRMGATAEVLDAGCCGLAGSFGFSADHEPVSRQIGEEHWLPRVRAALGDDDVLVADGFSCRTQLDHLAGPPAVTLPTLVRRALGG
ncbi:FAD/FMN-containing dehydrogenase [Motilibacter rhizosphaerae]|uniref:FAD/FMN-containing dehydrogenase n=1 Tax=Motilibacter rhizosphaerae TaxID=598652 RepID=A0A4V2F2R1_9ACTN|nr:FAD-binding and (Fe-S)-binding domain-containing protein [Motilibacter rhizosphaerae]RZS79028.1 FAD/FMN-containing dehydrogenase [Motilibacter rhizosphaerae]